MASAHESRLAATEEDLRGCSWCDPDRGADSGKDPPHGGKSPERPEAGCASRPEGRAEKIDARDIQTGQLRIRRVFERDSHGHETVFKHFAIAREISIKQRDVSRFDRFLTRFVSNAEVELDFSFDSSRRLELREETRLAAVQAARAKAEAMTEALGARLGEVLTIDEVASSGGLWSGSYHTNFDRPDPASRAPADLTGGTFAPGAIEVKISVEISFAIQSAPPGKPPRKK